MWTQVCISVQVVTADPIHKRIYAALGGDELFGPIAKTETEQLTHLPPSAA